MTETLGLGLHQPQPGLYQSRPRWVQIHRSLIDDRDLAEEDEAEGNFLG